MVNLSESGQSFGKEQREQEPKWKLTKRVVISGHPGSGKSFIIRELSKRYELSENQVFNIGDLFREWYKDKTGIHPTGYIERDLSKDREFDQFQIGLLSNKDSNKVFVLESKLGGFLYKTERITRDKNKGEPPVFTILLIVNEGVANQRVWNRDKKKNHHLTKEKSARQTRNRKKLDFQQWKQLYPILDAIGSPIGYKARTLYNWWIDTTKLNKKEVVEEIHRILVENGVVVRRETLPQEVTIFEAS